MKHEPAEGIIIIVKRGVRDVRFKIEHAFACLVDENTIVGVVLTVDIRRHHYLVLTRLIEYESGVNEKQKQAGVGDEGA